MTLTMTNMGAMTMARDFAACDRVAELLPTHTFLETIEILTEEFDFTRNEARDITEGVASSNRMKKNG